MNSKANLCVRCGFNVDMGICGQCGLCIESSQMQYCDQCACIIYANGLSTHNCREKESNIYSHTVREVPMELRPKSTCAKEFKCECGDILDIGNPYDHQCNMFDLRRLVICTECKQSVNMIMARYHNCDVKCPNCQADVPIDEKSTHECIDNTNSYAVVYSYNANVNYKTHEACETCKTCNEKIHVSGHECKRIANIESKHALCVACNADITENWRDHKCNRGDSYIDVRCADCTQLRTTMMFRFHSCKQGPQSVCGKCNAHVAFNQITAHSCNAIIPINQIVMKCIHCSNDIKYLSLHSHNETMHADKSTVYNYNSVHNYSHNYYNKLFARNEHYERNEHDWPTRHYNVSPSPMIDEISSDSDDEIEPFDIAICAVCREHLDYKTACTHNCNDEITKVLCIVCNKYKFTIKIRLHYSKCIINREISGDPIADKFEVIESDESNYDKLWYEDHRALEDY
jgi:hypothetical protein